MYLDGVRIALASGVAGFRAQRMWLDLHLFIPILGLPSQGLLRVTASGLCFLSSAASGSGEKGGTSLSPQLGQELWAQV